MGLAEKWLNLKSLPHQHFCSRQHLYISRITSNEPSLSLAEVAWSQLEMLLKLNIVRKQKRNAGSGNKGIPLYNVIGILFLFLDL